MNCMKHPDRPATHSLDTNGMHFVMCEQCAAKALAAGADIRNIGSRVEVAPKTEKKETESQ